MAVLRSRSWDLPLNPNLDFFPYHSFPLLQYNPAVMNLSPNDCGGEYGAYHFEVGLIKKARRKSLMSASSWNTFASLPISRQPRCWRSGKPHRILFSGSARFPRVLGRLWHSWRCSFLSESMSRRQFLSVSLEELVARRLAYLIPYSFIFFFHRYCNNQYDLMGWWVFG